MDNLENDDDSWQPYDPAKWEQSLPDLNSNIAPIPDIDNGPGSSQDGGADEDGQQAIVMDPHWVDVEEIRHWLYTCDLEHRQECNPASPEYAGRPLWLIDVLDECVVPASFRQYIALSYVWGQVTSSEAATSNIDLLQKPGVLGKENENIVIPETIRHSMKLVSLLGQRYLWVDRLCICQDDAETKHSQLHLMGDIYSNAYLTIVAANGWDANHGLRGIRGVTEPRHLRAHMVEVSAYLDHIKPDNSVWYSRGWTFQELLLSRRKLVFINQVVLWECCGGVWHESTGTSRNLPGNTSDRSRARNFNYVGVTPNLALNFNQANTLSGFTSLPMSAYLQVVRAYNIRNLTFPEDGLEAFLGVTQRIMDAFPHGFFGGLPVSAFDMALLWQPNEEVKRRRPKSKNTASTIQLPSWSWAGWQGEIDVNSWNYTYPPRERYYTGRSVAIKTLCKWKYEKDGVKLPILPDETKEHRTGNAIASRIKNVFTWNGLHSGVSPQVKAYLLSTRASVVKCKFGRIIADRSNTETGRVMRRIKHPWDINKVCGTILMTVNLASDVSESKIWELMAISESGVRWESDTVLKKDPAFSEMLTSYPSTAVCRNILATGELFYKYYNVMWIGTSIKGGISRRRALGIMSIEAWESLNPKEVNIELG